MASYEVLQIINEQKSLQHSPNAWDLLLFFVVLFIMMLWLSRMTKKNKQRMLEGMK